MFLNTEVKEILNPNGPAMNLRGMTRRGLRKAPNRMIVLTTVKNLLKKSLIRNEIFKLIIATNRLILKLKIIIVVTDMVIEKTPTISAMITSAVTGSDLGHVTTMSKARLVIRERTLMIIKTVEDVIMKTNLMLVKSVMI